MSWPPMRPKPNFTVRSGSWNRFRHTCRSNSNGPQGVVMGSPIGFWLLAVISVATAVLVVANRNPVRCALFLIVNFVCLAIFYLMLQAEVLAALQILVYAGAIMVLFLFVIMLLNLGGEQVQHDPLVAQRPLGVLFGVLLLGFLGNALARAPLPSWSAPP